VTDDRDDQREHSHEADAADVADADADRRPRSVWERRVAIALLVTFGAFVLFNVVTVLAMLYSGAMRGGGSPFGP
jgi:hypothetical protein